MSEEYERDVKEKQSQLDGLFVQRSTIDKQINILDNEIFVLKSQENERKRGIAMRKYVEKLKENVVVFEPPEIDLSRGWQYWLQEYGIEMYKYPLKTEQPLKSLDVSNYEQDLPKTKIVAPMQPFNDIMQHLYPYVIKELEGKLPVEMLHAWDDPGYAKLKKQLSNCDVVTGASAGLSEKFVPVLYAYYLADTFNSQCSMKSKI